jgi:hypothetical protein
VTCPLYDEGRSPTIERSQPNQMIDKIVLASAGGWDSPSARYRLGPLAESDRWDITAISAPSLPRGDRIEQMLELGDRSTVLILQRVMPSDADMRRVRSAFRAVLFDIDDAIYAVPPVSRLTISELYKRTARLVVRGSTRASARRRSLIATLRQVDAAIVGNEILGRFASQYAARVFEIPTTVDPVPRPPESRPRLPIVTWMGLPDNMAHLELVRRPLEQLRREMDFTLRIVSSSPWQRAPFLFEFVPWSEETSRDALLTSTVGLAPLSDDPWTRGKCALRSIQYGGHALPTVASPVGITERVVLAGRTGLLARTEADWYQDLRALLLDGELVERMGAAALAHVRAHYSNELAVARWSAVIDSVGVPL